MAETISNDELRAALLTLNHYCFSQPSCMDCIFTGCCSKNKSIPSLTKVCITCLDYER